MSNIVITGCSTGFGRDAAERFAGQGHHVFATMRNVDGKNARPAAELRALAEDQDWALHVVELDVADEDSVNAAAATVLDHCGAPDVVINNAAPADLRSPDRRVLLDQSWSGASTLKSRSTRSGAGRASRSRFVVRPFLRRVAP